MTRLASEIPFRQRMRGFTLVELMVAAAIIAILAAVAYPSYISHMIRSNRSAAEAHMLDLSQAEQQYLADQRSYASTVAALNMTTPAAVSSKYTILIEVQPGPPPTFLITATPIPSSSQASDGALTIDSSGTRSPGDKW